MPIDDDIKQGMDRNGYYITPAGTKGPNKGQPYSEYHLMVVALYREVTHQRINRRNELERIIAFIDYNPADVRYY